MRYPRTEVSHVPGEGAPEAPAGAALPSQPAPEPRAGQGPLPGRLRPRSAEGMRVRTLEFSGTAGSRRVPATLGQLCGGCTRGAERNPSGTAGRRGRAPPETAQSTPGAARASHPGAAGARGVIAPGQEALRFSDRSLGFSRWDGRGHGGRGECLERMEGAGSQMHCSWAHVTGLGRK